MNRSAAVLVGALALGVMSTATFAQGAPDAVPQQRINVHNRYTEAGNGYTAMASQDQYQAPVISQGPVAAMSPAAEAPVASAPSIPWYYATAEGNKP